MSTSTPNRKRGVPTPNVCGLSYVKARDLLREAGLTPSPVTQAVDDASLDNHILGQDPVAGEDVARGQSVTLLVGRASDQLFDDTVGRAPEPETFTPNFSVRPDGVRDDAQAPSGEESHLDPDNPVAATRKPADEPDVDELGLLRRAAGVDAPAGSADTAQAGVNADRDDLSSSPKRHPRRRAQAHDLRPPRRRREAISPRRAVAIGASVLAIVVLLVTLIVSLTARPAVVVSTQRPHLHVRVTVTTVTTPAATATITVAKRNRPQHRVERPQPTAPASAAAPRAKPVAPVLVPPPPAPEPASATSPTSASVTTRSSARPRPVTTTVTHPYLSPTGPTSGPAPINTRR